ncbi:MAG: pilus assembly protein N-terminal domain-containing protein, partial [Alphaproteobacteria bacterium]|nr:pilus assembly protein N-terminal domain-containing protein [Alphaproteobacteria bacterium]
MIRLSTESVRVTAARLGMAICAFALFTGVLGITAHPSRADKVNLVSVASDKQKKDPTLVLTMGMADIVDVDGPVSDIMVADPSVVDVLVLQANRLYMVGSRIGSTNIIAVDSEGNVIKRLNVRVKIDDGAIEDMVNDLFP